MLKYQIILSVNAEIEKEKKEQEMEAQKRLNKRIKGEVKDQGVPERRCAANTSS